MSQYGWFSLTNSEIRNQFITARDKYDTLQKTSIRHTLSNEYENFVTAHIETAAAKCIPTEPIRKNVKVERTFQESDWKLLKSH